MEQYDAALHRECDCTIAGPYINTLLYYVPAFYSPVPDAAPGLPSITLTKSRTVLLNWLGIDCVDRNGYLTYIIEYVEGNDDPKEIITGSSSTDYTMNNLVPNTRKRRRGRM